MKVNNLSKALSICESELYLRGRNELDKISKFRTIGAVIDIAINWDKDKNNELKGSGLDIDLSKITGVSIKRAEAWRNMYSCSKHADDDDTKQRGYRKLQRSKLRQIGDTDNCQ
jgi:hypothetical protein